MRSTKIIFRADGGPDIGLGHFVRTLALADMLRKDFPCTYATRPPTAWQRREMEAVCHDWIELPADARHFDAFLGYLQGDEIVVLDNYYFDTGYQRAIKDKGCQLVCIDDIHDKHFVADVVINHAVGVPRAAYSMEPYTRLLLGYSYAMLRHEFLHEPLGEERKRYSVLVLMGGADPKNITPQMVRAIGSLPLDLPAAVVTAPHSPPAEVPRAGAGFEIFERLPPRDVCRLMRESVTGVFPASTVAVEACAVRLPFVTGFFVENQREVCAGLQRLGLADCYGDLNDLDLHFLQRVSRLYGSRERRERIMAAQRQQMDKRSPERLTGVMRDLCAC
jgi:UDP-2,4-diacetamido-2,4,6-trideoxy-beta-L-altropyranose hydrolase